MFQPILINLNKSFFKPDLMRGGASYIKLLNEFANNLYLFKSFKKDS